MQLGYLTGNLNKTEVQVRVLSPSLVSVRPSTETCTPLFVGFCSHTHLNLQVPLSTPYLLTTCILKKCIRPLLLVTLQYHIEYSPHLTDDDGNVLSQKNLSDWAFREGKRMMLTGVCYGTMFILQILQKSPISSVM